MLLPAAGQGRRHTPVPSIERRRRRSKTRNLLSIECANTTVMCNSIAAAAICGSGSSKRKRSKKNDEMKTRTTEKVSPQATSVTEGEMSAMDFWIRKHAAATAATMGWGKEVTHLCVQKIVTPQERQVRQPTPQPPLPHKHTTNTRREKNRYFRCQLIIEYIVEEEKEELRNTC